MTQPQGRSVSLNAYYSTGGTVVPSTIGRFHILDRSTHRLLSPSSVANRQCIIDNVKRGRTYSELTYARSDSEASDLDGSSSCMEAANLSSLLLTTQHPSTTPSQHVASGNDPTESALSFIPHVDADASSIALLTPILTACYTRHGGAAHVAVEGLIQLLSKSDFFDLPSKPSTLSLLDLSVQVVCDVGTHGQEMIFPSCVQFAQMAVTFSKGELSLRTIGYLMRFYLFVFYFDSCIPRSSHATKWPSWRPAHRMEEEDFPMLWEPEDSSYLPGGAPQAAVLALKELVSLSIMRVGKNVTTTSSQETNTSEVEEEKKTDDLSVPDVHGYASMFEGVVSELIDGAVDHVERANITQLALHQIHRSGGSELFWNDMIHECGSGLFKDHPSKELFVLIFAILQQLVKISWGKQRPTGLQADFLPKDIASKLMSLEMLLHFLESWSDEHESLERQSPESVPALDTIAFVVRRTVIPCLFWNTRASLEHPQVFRRVIRIVSELWCSPACRRSCKAEMGMLIEHFALRVLELGPQCTPLDQIDGDSGSNQVFLLSQQTELVGEIKNWFTTDPKDVIELFLNYDTDLSSDVTGPVQLLQGSRWRIFQRLCAGLSDIAEKCGELIGDHIRRNQSMVLKEKNSAMIPSKGDRDLHRSTSKKSEMEIENAREAARVLRKVSLEALAQIVKALAISAAAVSGKEFAALLLSWNKSSLPDSPPTSGSMTPQKQNREGQDEAVLKFWRSLIVNDQKERFAATIPSSQESLDTAFDIAKRKSIKKAVEFLIACNTLTQSPRDIANFLRMNKERFDSADLGLYISEEGTSAAEKEYWNSLRYSFVRANSFIGMSVDESLRHFFTSSGYRLPGEAQRIDRLVNTFSQCFFEDNAGDKTLCPFKNQDTVYLLVFSIIMLNTDLHKTESHSKKARKKMSKADFMNNLRLAVQHETISRTYLSDVYDSVELNPIVMHEGETASTGRDVELGKIDEMLRNIRSTDSVLRGLAIHNFRFSTIADLMSTLEYSGLHALSDVTCGCVSKTWHHWHGVVNTCLETAYLDPQGMEPAVDIVLYAIAVTVCLNMPMERSAFLEQLHRMKLFEERRQGFAAPPMSLKQQWFDELDDTCAGLPKQKLSALHHIRSWIQCFKSALRVDVRNHAEMKSIVDELKDGEFLMHDPARSFLQSETLIKRSARTGRDNEYRFYLFSDILLYASLEVDGRYKIHQELPLHHMKIVDWFPNAKRSNVFAVHHPRKSFQVVCPSAEARRSWVNDIRASILVEMERKMTLEATRMSVATGNL